MRFNSYISGNCFEEIVKNLLYTDVVPNPEINDPFLGQGCDSGGSYGRGRSCHYKLATCVRPGLEYTQSRFIFFRNRVLLW